MRLRLRTDLLRSLLAVLISRPPAAHQLFKALESAAGDDSLKTVIASLQQVAPASQDPVLQHPDVQQGISDVDAWLDRHTDHAQARARDAAKWVPEVKRFSFTPLVRV